jgi:parallel beta-helix repeat protein
VQEGVYADANAANATLEDNDIFDNREDGVHCTGDSNLTLRRNTIHDNREDGVAVYWCHLTLEDSVIVENGGAGVSIGSATATLRRNRITGNRFWGVHVRGGNATIHDNDLRFNGSKSLDIVTEKSRYSFWGDKLIERGVDTEVDDRRNKK